MKLLIIPSLYSISNTALHFHYNTYFISANKDFSILYREIDIVSSKLEITFVVKFLKKELMPNYLIIVAKIFEDVFESIKSKLKIFNNR